MDAGRDMSAEELLEIVDSADADVTLTGGDPVYQAKEVAPFCRELKRRGRNIWLYTGFSYEALMENPAAKDLVTTVDVVVDGPFIESQRDIALLFRGSANQRLIDVALSRPDRIVEWHSDF